ncbi:hypothetical protein SAMN04487926_13838 [Paraburkholderia steynii]|uniref:Uncharacterized protein n=1 Tax=Paraburkholderia steynii TaxID=1245441 RepID=A0A7Z7BH68_9BURK|nr:hypothetical protein [Paraburkholderia steynii]SDJ22829.1 hypothetical protein SAMN04487926_13838 [Paraburkholderia steynii]
MDAVKAVVKNQTVRVVMGFAGVIALLANWDDVWHFIGKGLMFLIAAGYLIVHLVRFLIDAGFYLFIAGAVVFGIGAGVATLWKKVMA